MDEEARRQAQELSLQQVHPPLRLAGYEQEQFLGKGAFGEVWVAVNSNNGRRVAIKFYKRRGGLDWSLLTREVEKLRHLFTDRYVVQLFEVGWEADPPYYVMEYMENGSLEDMLRAGPLGVSEAVGLFHEIAVGLVHAHGKGILHCDLKPANILLDQDHKPRLADFGQSRLAKEQSPALGTLFYMAPEQADLRDVPDVRWDVYALGAILYRMLTGQPPYRTEAGASEIMSGAHLEERLKRYRRLLTESPPPTAHRGIPGIDAALVDIIDRCLAVNPRSRFANVQAVLDALKSRSAKLARRPLLVLGTLAPALVMIVMAVYATELYRDNVRKAKEELINRTLEADRFAAEAMAAEYAREIGKRWGILEREANNEELRRMLRTFGKDPQDDKHIDRELDKWLQKRREHWDEQAPSRGAKPLASEWFIFDRNGYLRALCPPDTPPSLNKYFGYRDYFHGTGRDRDEREEHLSPITNPHLSVPFKEKGGTGVWTVAFSVPIWSGDSADRQPVGVLGLMWGLETIPKVEGLRNQKVVLLDTRANQSGQRGMILRHPYLEELNRKESGDFHPFYNLEMGEIGYQLSQQRLGRGVPGTAEPASTLRDFEDPLGAESKEYSGRWLAALEPVLVPDRPRDVRDSGWLILIQERPGEALQPLQELARQFRALALQSIGVVLLVVIGLWAAVWLTLADSRGRRLMISLRRKLGLPSESAASSAASSSSSTPASSVPSHDPGSAKGPSP
jgi:hypothetical protein